jgi:general secretion pathway protein G
MHVSSLLLFLFKGISVKKADARRGFTLIELLIVIAIISLLAAVVLTSLGQTRTLVRDTRRANDLLELQKALERYHIDNNGYPSFPSGTGADNLAPFLVPNYIKKIPQPPFRPFSFWDYVYQSFTPAGTPINAPMGNAGCAVFTGPGYFVVTAFELHDLKIQKTSYHNGGYFHFFVGGKHYIVPPPC